MDKSNLKNIIIASIVGFTIALSIIIFTNFPRWVNALLSFFGFVISLLMDPYLTDDR